MREISRTAEKIDKKILPRKIIIKCNPHLIRLTPSDGGGGVRGENVKVTKHQVLKSISGMHYPGRSRVIRGREGRKEGGGERVPSEDGSPASIIIRQGNTLTLLIDAYT